MAKVVRDLDGSKELCFWFTPIIKVRNILILRALKAESPK